MYNYDHMSRTDWIGMGFMMVFVVIVLLVAIWAITQWMRTSDRPHLPADKSARDILDKRFARGEIESRSTSTRIVAAPLTTCRLVSARRPR